MILVEKVQREFGKTLPKDQQQMVTSSKKMENQIYIHPSTMTMCGLTFMCPAVVDRQHVLTAVPDSRLPITNVNVSELTARNVLDKKPGQHVILYALNDDGLAATEVRVRLMYVICVFFYFAGNSNTELCVISNCILGWIS